MAKIELIATTTFGLEAVVKKEVQNLGFQNIQVENGKVSFIAEEEAIPRANLWLRSAERVLLKMGEFKAMTFSELFERTTSLPWDEWITSDGEFTVTGKSIKSKLYSVPDCQAIVKKAVVNKLQSKYKKDWFEETGPKFTIEVSLLKDVATLTIDTSGVGLHKRGYRAEAVEAPIKETLAAALVQLSYWNPDRVLWDPLCGSGTIPIEAAMIARNIAPGLQRDFASEDWPRIGKSRWKEARVAALKAIKQDADVSVVATDKSETAIEIAKENAYRAGVDDCITFDIQNVAHIQPEEEYGVIMCNPPYGERIGGEQEVEDLYRSMGKAFNKLHTWSIYVITAHPKFEKLFGKRASKKRKLYNGRIKVDYFQFFGPPPPRK